MLFGKVTNCPDGCCTVQFCPTSLTDTFVTEPIKSDCACIYNVSEDDANPLKSYVPLAVIVIVPDGMPVNIIKVPVVTITSKLVLYELLIE